MLFHGHGCSCCSSVSIVEFSWLAMFLSCPFFFVSFCLLSYFLTDNSLGPKCREYAATGADTTKPKLTKIVGGPVASGKAVAIGT